MSQRGGDLAEGVVSTRAVWGSPMVIIGPLIVIASIAAASGLPAVVRGFVVAGVSATLVVVGSRISIAARSATDTARSLKLLLADARRHERPLSLVWLKVDGDRIAAASRLVRARARVGEVVWTDAVGVYVACVEASPEVAQSAAVRFVALLGEAGITTESSVATFPEHAVSIEGLLAVLHGGVATPHRRSAPAPAERFQREA